MKYDIVVIGSGPAGQKAAIQSAKEGRKTLVIDRRNYKLGGVSLHSGTIPSKTLREAVLYLKGLKRKKIYGKSRRFSDTIALSDLMERVEIILEYELKIIEEQFKRNGIDVVYGQASFLDRNRLIVRDRDQKDIMEISANKVIIATGTVPRHPSDIEFDYQVIFDSNFIFSTKSKLKSLPKSLIVYGAGVIGSEYAAMFAALGCNVRLIDNHPSLFPYLDREIVEILMATFEQYGVTITLGSPYRDITVSDKGRGVIRLENGQVFEADAILFSKGRIPCVAPLELDSIGVQTSERKTIKTNENYETSIRDIFACGDVIGFPALASTSAEQGRVAGSSAVGLDIDQHSPDLFPAAIYTIPEISYIGKTEEQLVRENTPYQAGIAYFNEVAKAAIAGDDTGMLKILFDPVSLNILGIHIIGEQAAEIVHIGQMVMAFKGTLDCFIHNVFNYPTWAEAYKVAALNGIAKV